MSAQTALSLPQEHPDSRLRHVEIVSSRQQRLARPRLVYSLVIVVGLFVVLAIQLLLSIALADGAYQLSALQAEQKELARSHQSVTEELHVLGSPQNLAARAESLGMVSSTSAVYLNLANGKVLGSPTAASPTAGNVVDKNGELLISNSLLATVPGTVAHADDAQAGDAQAGDTQVTTGAPDLVSVGGSVTSTPTGIPGPSTR